MNTNYSSLSHVWASFASNRPTLGASCVGSVGRQSQLLAPRCASFASTRPTVCANCVGSPQVRRQFQLLGPRLASFASTRPTLGANCVRSHLDANCVTWLHVRRQLQLFTCVCLYLDFGDSTYTRGSDFVLVCRTKSWTRLIHAVDLYTKIYGR